MTIYTDRLMELLVKIQNTNVVVTVEEAQAVKFYTQDATVSENRLVMDQPKIRAMINRVCVVNMLKEEQNEQGLC